MRQATRMWALVLGLALAAVPAAAGVGLAPAGPCAGEDALPALGPRAPEPGRSEPGDADPRAADASGPARGPIHLRFSPADVAAPGAAWPGPPAAGSLPARGPCDDPGSGCLGPLRPAGQPALPAPPAPPPPPPVAVDPDPDPGCGGPGFPCERLRP